MKKIYIIGPVGSGKTTFSNKLAEKLKIKKYELDKVSWDDENGNIKREAKEVEKIFNEIINQKSWIIEDIGRDKFKKGREKADVIYYLKLNKLKSYYRVTKRWIKQRLGLERYNYPPNLEQFLYYYSTVRSFYKKEKELLKSLEEYKDKVIFLNKKEIMKILEND